MKRSLKKQIGVRAEKQRPLMGSSVFPRVVNGIHIYIYEK